jgi:flavin reductase (DIM6/NTAB) family NADH-FMN oxidoreductase RutF
VVINVPRHSSSEDRSAQAAIAAAALVSRVDYPMFVVTAAAADEASGCLAGFVTQCSIDPTRFLVCISKRNHTYDVAAQACMLGVHLLGRDQLPLARVFGEMTGDEVDKFSLVQWHEGETGAPLLDDCAAWFQGEILDRYDLGDHIGYLVQPVSGGGGGEAGELWYSSTQDLRPGHAASD